MKAPMMPMTMSPRRPKPPPLTTMPASQPATAPIRSQIRTASSDMGSPFVCIRTDAEVTRIRRGRPAGLFGAGGARDDPGFQRVGVFPFEDRHRVAVGLDVRPDLARDD